MVFNTTLVWSVMDEKVNLQSLKLKTQIGMYKNVLFVLFFDKSFPTTFIVTIISWQNYGIYVLNRSLLASRKICNTPPHNNLSSRLNGWKVRLKVQYFVSWISNEKLLYLLKLRETWSLTLNKHDLYKWSRLSHTFLLFLINTQIIIRRPIANLAWCE